MNRRVTPRQLDILRLLAHCHSDQEIAHALGTSYHTVKNQMSTLRQAWHVQDRVALLVAALLSGVLTLDDLEAPEVPAGARWC